jgi:hypothetical protein
MEFLIVSRIECPVHATTVGDNFGLRWQGGAAWRFAFRGSPRISGCDATFHDIAQAAEIATFLPPGWKPGSTAGTLPAATLLRQRLMV